MRLKVARKDAEDVGRRAADVDADRVDSLLPGDHLQDVADRSGRRHDRRVGPADELVVAGSVGHHVLEEQVVNPVASRPEIFPFEDRPQVGHHEQLDAVAQRITHQIGGVLIARVDQRHAIVLAEPRLRPGWSDPLGDLHDLGRVPAVGAAGDQNHVGPQLADPLNLLVRQPLVVGGDHVHDDRAGPERGPLALAAVISRTMPATIICSPPPALEVEM